MVHTLPDYTTKYKQIIAFQGADVYEAAVRLGSINTYDRRGNVVLYDDFEAPFLRWNVTGSTSGYDAYLTTEDSRLGTQCLKMEAPAGAGETVSVQKSIPYPTLKTIGLEISFRANQYCNAVRLIATAYDGSTAKTSGIYINPPAGEFLYQTSAGSWQPMETGIAVYYEKHMFHTMKYVVDLETGYYKRASLDNRHYDLSTKPVQQTSNTTDPHLLITIVCRTSGATAATAWIDSFIFTVNEP